MVVVDGWRILEVWMDDKLIMMMYVIMYKQCVTSMK